jgi:hypothetical protein
LLPMVRIKSILLLRVSAAIQPLLVCYPVICTDNKELSFVTVYLTRLQRQVNAQLLRDAGTASWYCFGKWRVLQLPTRNVVNR